MKKISRRNFLMAAGVTAAALGLTACGSSSSSTAASTAGSTAASTVEEPGWKSGDTVYVHVPAKAGGGSDLYTRYLTAALGEVCPGVNFVVNNYDTGEVGMEAAKTADPDGLNLGMNHGGGIIQWLTGASNVSMKDDVRVIGVITLGGPQAIIANPDAPYTNFAEFGEYMKSNPGDVVIGCSLGGTTQMIFVSLVDALTGDSANATYVQCSSEADKLTQTAAGAINIANCSLPNALQYQADGKLTILGTIGPKMSTIDEMEKLMGLELNDSFKSGPEQGIDSATWDSAYYLFAPKDTPDEICEAINAAVCKAVETASYQEGMKAMAGFYDALDLAEVTATFEAEWEFMDALTTDMGLKVR